MVEAIVSVMVIFALYFKRMAHGHNENFTLFRSRKCVTSEIEKRLEFKIFGKFKATHCI